MIPNSTYKIEKWDKIVKEDNKNCQKYFKKFVNRGIFMISIKIKIQLTQFSLKRQIRIFITKKKKSCEECKIRPSQKRKNKRKVVLCWWLN